MAITRREAIATVMSAHEAIKVKCEYCDDDKPGRRTIVGHEEQCEFCGGTNTVVSVE